MEQKDKQYYDKLTQKLGEETIYGQAVEAAQELIQSLGLGKNPLLCAQMQQGKTAVTLYAANLWINNCKYRNLVPGEGFEVYYLINISNNDLSTQTWDRIENSRLDRDITRDHLIHRANFKKVKPHRDSQRLLIIDECHLALTENGDFKKLMKKFGINYGRPKSEWSNPNNYVISVSATPFSHVLRNFLAENRGLPPVFDRVWLPLDEEYYSFEQLRDSGRMKQSKSVINIDTKKVTPFFVECMEELKKFVEENGNKYYIIRQTENFRFNAIAEWVKENQPEWNVVDAKVTGKKEDWNIKKLHDKPARTTVVVIRGILRAGQTIDTDQHIGGWIESYDANADAMAQSLRILGRDKKEYNRKRSDSRFPVYCNMKETEEIIKFFRKEKVAPSSVTNEKSAKVTTEWKQVLLDLNERSKVDPSEVSKIALSHNIQFDQSKGTAYHEISKNDRTDIALELLRNTGYTQGNGTPWREFFCDEANPKYQDSWDRLMAKHPLWKGKYILCFPLETRTEHQFSPALFKTKSIWPETIRSEPPVPIS